ncbi:unnamed protein product [Toxocara canis]|uniref:Zf-Sec23_Sec24 domain-containing protein n=1 Tax=Toxocara canis TaxID=6265 RepID=A0A183U0P4_TOXCA|nr:unnamed protein product [Toxocara canis]
MHVHVLLDCYVRQPHTDGVPKLYSGKAESILAVQSLAPPHIADREVSLAEACRSENYLCSDAALHHSRFVDLMQRRDLLSVRLDDTDIAVPSSVCNPTAFSTPGAYINPYIYLPDTRHWQCNLCQKLNELPDDFILNSRNKPLEKGALRPELRSGSVEFIASSEFTSHPPHTFVYIFVLDVSHAAVESGLRLVFVLLEIYYEFVSRNFRFVAPMTCGGRQYIVEIFTTRAVQEQDGT